jgi:hypothetical protein
MSFRPTAGKGRGREGQNRAGKAAEDNEKPHSKSRYGFVLEKSAPDRIRTCDLMLRRALPCADLHRSPRIYADSFAVRADSEAPATGRCVTHFVTMRRPWQGLTGRSSGTLAHPAMALPRPTPNPRRHGQRHTPSLDLGLGATSVHPRRPPRPALAGAVLRILLLAIRTALRRGSPGAGPDAQIGAVSFLHRFGAALNPHFQFHLVVFDGVFTETIDGVRFHEATHFSC